MNTTSVPLRRIRPLLGWMVRHTLEALEPVPRTPSPAPRGPVELDIDLSLLERLEEAEWHTRPAAYCRRR
jgi:hypothetical protein